MISRSWLAFSAIVLIAVALAVIYSHHGLLDLRRFYAQIEATHSRIALIEEENRNFKKQAELLEHPSAELTERQVRTVLGWAKPDEIVYFDKISN
jgi:cell division protein FtsB